MGIEKNDSNEVTRSESGAPIFVHTERKRPVDLVMSSSDDLELIESHIEKHIGKPEYVWHELISDMIHLDVHHVKPTPKRNVHTLITTGMSDIAMKAPKGFESFCYAELLVTLPPEWPVDDEAFQDEKNYWIVGLLKTLARLPHAYETWLWHGHTVPNGNPPARYHRSTKFVGAILAPPVTVAPGFLTIECNPDKTVHFFSVVPLYQQEMDLKLKKGIDPLFDLFDKNDINEVVDIGRKNVAAKGWWPF